MTKKTPGVYLPTHLKKSKDAGTYRKEKKKY